MAGPLGVLSGFPVVATTKVGDVDGRPPRLCWQQVRQWPPPNLKTSMVVPLGGAVGISGSGHHRSWRCRWRAPPGGYCWDFRQRPPPKLETSMAAPLGVLAAGLAATTTEVGYVDGGPLRGGAGAGDPGAATINAVKTSTVGALGGGVGAGGPRAPTRRAINLHGYHR
jgi:hypothetical protein